MNLACGLGPRCDEFKPWRDHTHEHNDARCTQANGGIACPGDGECVSNWRAACHVGDELRRFKREREARAGHDHGDEDVCR